MMKTLALLALLAAKFSCTFSQTGKVIIHVKGVELKKGGEVSVGFFTKENFPKVGRQSFGTTKEVNSTTMEIVFENAAAGQYGIAVFQDVDRNKELKTNFVGFPTEPIGFSNDARVRFGPPSFEDARINVEKDKTLTLVIQLR